MRTNGGMSTTLVRVLFLYVVKAIKIGNKSQNSEFLDLEMPKYKKRNLTSM